MVKLICSVCGKEFTYNAQTKKQTKCGCGSIFFRIKTPPQATIEVDHFIYDGIQDMVKEKGTTAEYDIIDTCKWLRERGYQRLSNWVYNNPVQFIQGMKNGFELKKV